MSFSTSQQPGMGLASSFLSPMLPGYTKKHRLKDEEDAYALHSRKKDVGVVNLPATDDRPGSGSCNNSSCRCRTGMPGFSVDVEMRCAVEQL
jgi:hypothetical protein